MSAITRPLAGLDPVANTSAAYRIVWRWHFYAGVFCLPFIVVLCLSGSIYLFKPQIDAYLDRDFDHLVLTGAPKSLDEQVAAALAAAPGARLKGLELREDPADAARVHVMTPEGAEMRVFVRPDTLEVMQTQPQKSRLTALMHDLHGELLLGDPGSIAVELAGAWAIVMVITGLYLWWPRSNVGLAGVLYPRLGGGSRQFLRDLHAVTGLWLSLLALFFLISALPWTKVWGSGLKYVRSSGQPAQARQDWTTGPASAQQQRMETFRNAPPAQAEDEHAEHRSMAEHAGHKAHALNAGFDEIAAQVLPLNLAPPVFISPPSPKKATWTARSDSQNRPARRSLEFSPGAFEQVKEESFSDRPLFDRVIGVAIAAHEGQLFGWANQLLGLVTALGYLTLVVTAALMWLRRRPQGVLGAPPALAQRPRLAVYVVALIAALGVFLPTLGVSLIFVLICEALMSRYWPGASRWLGLTPKHRPPNEAVAA